MSPIPLLPSWSAAVQQPEGLFPLGDGRSIPADWGPDLARLAPEALPTPFGRAEAMRLLLADIDAAGSHEYLQWFQCLVLGVASGVLVVECDDLRNERYDNLGRALLSVEPEGRYFCHLRWPGPRGKRRSFGMSNSAALMWPHARRVAAEWNELANELQPLKSEALALLAEWRAALRAGKRWAPQLAGCEWQRGIDHVLASANTAEPSPELRRLSADCRFVGPAWIGLPTGLPGTPVRNEPVYLPSLFPGHAKRFARLCRLKPTQAPKQDGIVFSDRERVLGHIAIPAPGVEGNALALGAGAIRFEEGLEASGGAVDDWVNGKPGEPGLLELLRPLVAALEARDPGRIVDAEHVRICPPLYPDPVRLLFDLGLWPAPGQGRLVQSSRLRAALVESGKPQPSALAIKEAGGQVVELGGTVNRVTMYLVDEVAGRAIGDLRALGSVLFMVFSGEARVDAGKVARADATSGLGFALESTSERPLEPADWVYAQVNAPPPDRLRGRLATLQRFVRACADPGTGLHPTLDVAARAFTSWASGGVNVAPLGRRAEARVVLRLSTGEELKLPIDPVRPVGFVGSAAGAGGAGAR